MDNPGFYSMLFSVNRKVTCVVAINGSPGTRNTALPFLAASRMMMPFSSSSSRLETTWTFLPHNVSKLAG